MLDYVTSLIKDEIRSSLLISSLSLPSRIEWCNTSWTQIDRQWFNRQVYSLFSSSDWMRRCILFWERRWQRVKHNGYGFEVANRLLNADEIINYLRDERFQLLGRKEERTAMTLVMMSLKARAWEVTWISVVCIVLRNRSSELQRQLSYTDTFDRSPLHVYSCRKKTQSIEQWSMNTLIISLRQQNNR